MKNCDLYILDNKHINDGIFLADFVKDTTSDASLIKSYLADSSCIPILGKVIVELDDEWEPPSDESDYDEPTCEEGLCGLMTLNKL